MNIKIAKIICRKFQHDKTLFEIVDSKKDFEYMIVEWTCRRCGHKESDTAIVTDESGIKNFISGGKK